MKIEEKNMESQSDYDRLLKEYRELQLRVTQFSFVEQELINTRYKLDHELVLYRRLQRFGTAALLASDDRQFRRQIAESIIDVFELESAMVLVENREANEIDVESESIDVSKVDIPHFVKVANDNYDVNAVIVLTDELLANTSLQQDYYHGVYYRFKELVSDVVIHLVGLVSRENAPLYVRLAERRKAMFDLFVHQIISLWANRSQRAQIQAQLEKLKYTELELKKLSRIATMTKNGVVIANPEGRIEWVNEAFQRITGYSMEEVKGLKPKEFLQRGDVDSDVSELLSKALKSEKDVEVTIVNYTKQGERYYNNLQITPVFDDQGKLINFIALQRDITKEINFKSELLRVNSRFELITSQSNIGIWEWDGATGIAEWNDVLFEQYGRTPVAWTNTNQVEWVASLHPEDRERVLSANESLVNGESDIAEMEFRIIRQNDHSVRLLKGITIAERDETRKLLRLVGSSVDITESRRVKEKLEAGERKYRGIIENMNLGLVEWDSSGVVVFANKQFLELTNAQIGEKVLDGKSASSDLRTMLNKGRILHFKEVTSEAFEVDFEMKKSGKRSFLVRVAPVEDESAFTGYIAVFFDVTSIHLLQHELEDALRHKEESITRTSHLKSFYESILNHSPAEVAVFLPNGELTFVNARLLDSEPEWKSVMHSNIFDIVTTGSRFDDKLDKTRSALQQARRRNRLLQYEELRDDGSAKLISVLPYFRNHELDLIIVSGIDISELKKIETDLVIKNIELKKINLELDNFVYSVSHDLRSPLLAIRGLLSLIFNENKIDDSTVKYLNMIDGSVGRLDTTIQEILSYSRNARTEIASVEFNIHELVSEVYEDLKFSANGKIHFQVETQGPSLIVGDKSRVAILLKNIIGNAIKYSKNDEEARVDVRIENADDRVKIDISDNGEGISEKSLPKVFDMFYRASNNSVGTGLGLFISQEMVTKLGGIISADSTLGVGTTIKIDIPNRPNR